MESIDKWVQKSEYLESSSNKKELLTALFESSVISTLIFAITYIYTHKNKIITRLVILNHIS